MPLVTCHLSTQSPYLPGWSGWTQAWLHTIYRLQTVFRLKTVDRLQTISWLHTVMRPHLCARVDSIESLHLQARLHPVSPVPWQARSLQGGHTQGVHPLADPRHQVQGVHPLMDPCQQVHRVHPLTDSCPCKIHCLLLAHKSNEQHPQGLENMLHTGLYNAHWTHRHSHSKVGSVLVRLNVSPKDVQNLVDGCTQKA